MACRDCRTCTDAALVRLVKWCFAVFCYVITIGVLYVLKHGLRRHCPQCGHVLGNHRRRSDGSFKD
ncbi:hypothetical protein [Allokutzneria albata]|uniref:LITAF domain-containing protein n=1 Tax=Allokutzneria albata TaxID=211114 RepID=A0A1G9WUR3_ALLAB|nr:hypothetical protein [Allokutzneria albata]SDM88119.1 hypothetical protein SAMN04489726_3819 [Allokutzneria albata]